MGSADSTEKGILGNTEWYIQWKLCIEHRQIQNFGLLKELLYMTLHCGLSLKLLFCLCNRIYDCGAALSSAEEWRKPFSLILPFLADSDFAPSSIFIVSSAPGSRIGKDWLQQEEESERSFSANINPLLVSWGLSLGSILERIFDRGHNSLDLQIDAVVYYRQGPCPAPAISQWHLGSRNSPGNSSCVMVYIGRKSGTILSDLGSKTGSAWIGDLQGRLPRKALANYLCFSRPLLESP